jgi:dTDP-4-dehydrorhamnose 3,5-epimerase
MIFTETKLKGAFIIEPERLEDNRGFFARICCQHEFEAHNITFVPVQCNISYNKKRGTLRGMHYQISPFEECRLVRCTAGAIFDVIIDLRSGSPTLTEHFEVVLTAQNYQMLYIPKGFAHGFQTLQEHSEVYYQMSEFYVSEASKGVRWNDPTFGIEWPVEDLTLSKRDQEFPDFLPGKILE